MYTDMSNENIIPILPLTEALTTQKFIGRIQESRNIQGVRSYRVVCNSFFCLHFLLYSTISALCTRLTLQCRDCIWWRWSCARSFLGPLLSSNAWATRCPSAIHRSEEEAKSHCCSKAKERSYSRSLPPSYCQKPLK